MNLNIHGVVVVPQWYLDLNVVFCHIYTAILTDIAVHITVIVDSNYKVDGGRVCTWVDPHCHVLKRAVLHVTMEIGRVNSEAWVICVSIFNVEINVGSNFLHAFNRIYIKREVDAIKQLHHLSWMQPWNNTSANGSQKNLSGDKN